jgi:hypothetical protein
VNIQRSLKDIQAQADRLLKGKPTMEQLAEFDRYNNELKVYLKRHIQEQELVMRINSIPNILEDESQKNVSKNLLVTLLLFILPWAVAYFKEQQKIENALSKIHEAKGKYSSIEFLSRNN